MLQDMQNECAKLRTLPPNNHNLAKISPLYTPSF